MLISLSLQKKHTKWASWSYRMSGKNLNPHFLLADLLPSISLKVEYGYDANDMINRKYHVNTSPLGKKCFICKECGMPFISNDYKKVVYFCSKSCATRFTSREKAKRVNKLLYKVVNQKAFSEWFKRYNNIVIGYIYNNYDSEWREDLIDCWTDKALYWYYRCVNKDKSMGFLKTCLHNYFLFYKREKKEVFYDECNYKTQEKILGSYNT